MIHHPNPDSTPNQNQFREPNQKRTAERRNICSAPIGAITNEKRNAGPIATQSIATATLRASNVRRRPSQKKTIAPIPSSIAATRSANGFTARVKSATSTATHDVNGPM